MLQRLLSHDLPRSPWLALALLLVLVVLAFAPFLFEGARAMSVARARSSAAPVEASPSTMTSAARPPMRTAILASSSGRDIRNRSSVGRWMV